MVCFPGGRRKIWKSVFIINSTSFMIEYDYTYVPQGPWLGPMGSYSWYALSYLYRSFIVLALSILVGDFFEEVKRSKIWKANKGVFYGRLGSIWCSTRFSANTGTDYNRNHALKWMKYTECFKSSARFIDERWNILCIFRVWICTLICGITREL